MKILFFLYLNWIKIHQTGSELKFFETVQDDWHKGLLRDHKGEWIFGLSTFDGKRYSIIVNYQLQFMDSKQPGKEDVEIGIVSLIMLNFGACPANHLYTALVLQTMELLQRDWSCNVAYVKSRSKSYFAHFMANVEVRQTQAFCFFLPTSEGPSIERQFRVDSFLLFPKHKKNI